MGGLLTHPWSDRGDFYGNRDAGTVHVNVELDCAWAGFYVMGP